MPFVIQAEGVACEPGKPIYELRIPLKEGKHVLLNLGLKDLEDIHAVVRSALQRVAMQKARAAKE